MFGYKKEQVKIPVLMIFILFFILFLNITVNAQENIKVYNRNEEVILSHDLFYYNEQYYIHIDDLQQLGFSVSEDNNAYTLSSIDCLGEERCLIVKPITDSSDIIITPLYGLMSKETAVVEKVFCNGSYRGRFTKVIGHSNDIGMGFPTVANGFEFSLNSEICIKVNDELYISTQYVGNYLSHKFSVENGRIDFYIANVDSSIIETTINLVEGELAPSGGYDIKIYTAYKIGEGNTIDNFEILSSYDCTIRENENDVSCIIETQGEKISDNNIYFIVDFGERYSLAYSKYDFSNVGKVLVYGQHKDVTYTVDINLPSSDARDVPFTVYVEADCKTYSKHGIVNVGEESSTFEFEGLPVAKRYRTRIEFDYHKYKNAILEDFEFLHIAYAKDFKTDFEAEYSRVVVCDLSLPDDFVPDGDVEVKVKLSKYVPDNSLTVIVDKLTDWSDSKIVTLNNQKRSEQIFLYSQASSSQLYYMVVNGTDVLCQYGYLHTGGKVSSDRKSLKEIKEDAVVQMQLLQKKKIRVNVFIPLSLSNENDIFAYAILDDVLTASNKDLVMDFTQTPLIPSGKWNSYFCFELAEDKSYTMKIADITGDERLFDYCCYEKYFESPADETKKRYISFRDDEINITLLQCNNISGKIECETPNLNFDVLATCSLYSGGIIRLAPTVQNGQFSLKIPEDTDTYILDVQTIIGKKSYYVADGISTNDINEATEISFEYDDDRNIVIKYIVQNPTLPIEISTNMKCDYYIFENTSDYTIESFIAYIAYYDTDGRLFYLENAENYNLISGFICKIPVNLWDYRIRKVKAFCWKNTGLTPIGNVVETNVNMPTVPEENKTFKDIDSSNIFCEAISNMYSKGVIVGDENDYFNPYESLLRSEAAVFFSRTKGYECLSYKFECSDVPADHWAKSWIGICINEHIFDLENDRFRPNDYITVKETIVAALKMIGKNHEEYLKTAKEIGLLTNVDTENVERNITRAEITQILYNILKSEVK